MKIKILLLLVFFGVSPVRAGEVDMLLNDGLRAVYEGAQEGNISEPARLLSALLNREPKNCRARFELEIVNLWSNGKGIDAYRVEVLTGKGKALNEIITECKDAAKAGLSFYMKAIIRSFHRDYDSALVEIDQALKLDSGNAEYHLLKGRILLESGQKFASSAQVRQAAESFKAAKTALAKRDIPYLPKYLPDYWLGIALLAAAPPMYQEAISSLNEANARIAGKNVGFQNRVYRNLATALYQLGNCPDAKAAITKDTTRTEDPEAKKIDAKINLCLEVRNLNKIAVKMEDNSAIAKQPTREEVLKKILAPPVLPSAVSNDNAVRTSGSSKWKRRLTQRECELEAQPETCFANNKHCNSLKDDQQRDLCFADVKECNKVKDKFKSFYCHATSQGASISICDDKSYTEPEAAVCKYLFKKNILEPSERFALIGKFTKSEAIMTSNAMNSSFVLPIRFKPEDSQKVFFTCIDSPIVNKFVGGQDGYRRCSNISFSNPINPDYENQLDSCGSTGTWKNCSYPVYAAEKRLMSSPNEELKKKVVAVVNRLCAGGDPNACGFKANNFIQLAPEDADLKLICDRTDSESHCQTWWSRTSFKDPKGSLKELLSKAKTTIPFVHAQIYMALNSKRISVEEIRKDVLLFASACTEVPQACSIVYEIYKHEKNQPQLDMTIDSIYQFAKKTMNKQWGCSEASMQLFNHPEVKTKFEYDCAKGNIRSCITARKFSIQMVDDACKKFTRYFDAKVCYEKFLSAIDCGNGAEQVGEELCGKVETHSFCQGRIEAFLMRLKTNHSLEQDYSFSCEKEKRVGKCAVLGKYFLESNPELSAKYYRLACEHSGYQEKSCLPYFRKLANEKKLKELERQLSSACNSYGPSNPFVCSRKDSLILLAGGANSTVPKLMEKCEAGYDSVCEDLRDYFVGMNATEELRVLERIVCKRGCQGDWLNGK